MASLNAEALKQRFVEEWEQTVVRVRSNSSFQGMERRYSSLSDKDRLIVNILAVVFSLFLLYQLVISPAFQYLNGASRDYKNKLEGYEWMESQKEETKALLTKSKSEREGSLLSVASNTAKKHNLNFTNFEPDGDERLRLRLENIKFNDLVSWLGELELQQGVSAVDIAMDGGTSSGYVDVRLTLQG